MYFHTFISIIPPHCAFMQTTSTNAQIHHFVDHLTMPIIPTLIYEYATPIHGIATYKTLPHLQIILNLQKKHKKNIKYSFHQ